MQSKKWRLNGADVRNLLTKVAIFAGPQAVMMLTEYQEKLPVDAFWTGFAVSMIIYAIQLLRRK